MFGQLLAAAGSRRQTFDALVRHVAASSVDAVRTQVIDRVIGMGPAEARGYIRGRGGRELRRQARLTIRRHTEVNPAWEPLLAQRAADRVAAMLLRELSAVVVRGGSFPLRAA